MRCSPEVLWGLLADAYRRLFGDTLPTFQPPSISSLSPESLTMLEPYSKLYSLSPN